MKQQYEKKIFRLMFILNRLTSREMVTPSILASEFNVTVRTVQRDLEMLSMTGFPLFSENGSYKFIDGFSLRKISVNPDEKFLLLLFYKLFSKIGQPFDAAAKNLLDKMLLSSDKEDQSFDKKATDIIKKEFGEFSEQLAVKLEHSNYPQVFIKKVDEYLFEVNRKLKVLSVKVKVDMKCKSINKYENGKQVAIIQIPKTYFKDKIDKFDFSTREDNREFQIKTYLPNKFFKSFRISLSLHLAFNFWGTHLKARQITCFDDFAIYFGFPKELKRFTYEFSHGTNTKEHKILITTAFLHWEKEVPMAPEDIRPFLKKSGGLRAIVDYSRKLK